MALTRKFPISHVKVIKPFCGSDYKVLNSAVDYNAINGRTVRGIRPDRSVIRHERGGFNG